MPANSAVRRAGMFLIQKTSCTVHSVRVRAGWSREIRPDVTHGRPTQIRRSRHRAGRLLHPVCACEASYPTCCESSCLSSSRQAGELCMITVKFYCTRTHFGTLHTTVNHICTVAVLYTLMLISIHHRRGYLHLRSVNSGSSPTVAITERPRGTHNTSDF